VQPGHILALVFQVENGALTEGCDATSRLASANAYGVTGGERIVPALTVAVESCGELWLKLAPHS
jgi:hypothetical protein